MAPPLSGVRVLEVANFIAGPFCAMQLADLGADVVKIELPGVGDMVRGTAPFIEGESSNFVRLNRNKRSLALDLKNDTGKELFRRLADDADIVVENLRPGAMTKLGLDYTRLCATNPSLIYVAASGWGQDGPYAQQAGLDIMAQGMSGLMSITGEHGGAPVKVGVPVCDLACALYGALAAVTALHARTSTGRGQFIDVSLLEAGVSLAVWEAGRYFATGEVPERQGTAHQTSAPYQAVRAQDGHFTLGATSPATWAALCHVLNLEQLLADPAYADNRLRHRNREALIARIEVVTETEPVGHWLTRLQRAGVPCGAIRGYDAVFNDEHLRQREFFPEVPHTRLGPVRQLASPMRLSDTPARLDRAGPLLGEHSIEILTELGVSPAEIDELFAASVIAAPDLRASNAF
ncbi:MAG TPA: CoA transferase [Pseudonocardia sp.]|uniref:CaiB/BaiF CoA transferase family protein n=1 Tax=Pseudonocardia sp. TaxID=60912 RepID=UPI002EDB73B9